MKKIVLSTIAVLALSMPLYAQDKPAEKAGEKKEEAAAAQVSEADIAEAAKTITATKGDAAKQKVYCEMADLGNKAEEAMGKNDEKAAEQFGKQAEEKATSLGAEFGKAMETIAQLDPEDKTGEALFKALDDLDKSCGGGKAAEPAKGDAGKAEKK